MLHLFGKGKYHSNLTKVNEIIIIEHLAYSISITLIWCGNIFTVV